MLGVLKVAAVLQRSGHDVDVLDLSAPTAHSVASHFEQRGPSDVYGITATMPQMPEAASIARAIGWVAPSARVILGGAHVTMINAAARSGVQRSARMLEELRGVFDTVVAGDGERAIFQAISPNAPFLIDADQPTGELFLTPKDVAEAPWPARDMIDLHSYHCLVGGVPATSVIGQLGCPYRCGFCGGRNSPTFRRMRTRPADDVVNELCDIVDRFGYKGFMFLDDELNVSKAFPDLLRAIASAQTRRGEEWRLCGLLKSELFTQEQADLMYAAGFRKLLIGFESGDERILLNMQKNATVAHNTRAIQMAHNAGLRIKALMSLGHPGESAESIERTKDWLLETEPDEFDATVLTIYPGTPYHDEAVETSPAVWTYTAKRGDRLHFKSIDQFIDTPYYKGIPGKYESFVWTDYLSGHELVTLRDELERDVRDTLSIPWPKTAAEVNFEHSMACNG
jgi:anaerobic magnesium-protoporphyrin IX monomethyl ester cyclase